MFKHTGGCPETTVNVLETIESHCCLKMRFLIQVGFLRPGLSEMFVCQGLCLTTSVRGKATSFQNARACQRRKALPPPAPHLNRHPHAVRYSGGGGGVVWCYLNTMYVCIYRKTDAPQLYLFPFKRPCGACRVGKGLCVRSSSPNNTNRSFICMSW